MSKSAAKTLSKGKRGSSQVGQPTISQAATLRKAGSAINLKSRNKKHCEMISNTLDYRYSHLKKNSMAFEQFGFNVKGEFGRPSRGDHQRSFSPLLGTSIPAGEHFPQVQK